VRHEVPICGTHQDPGFPVEATTGDRAGMGACPYSAWTKPLLTDFYLGVPSIELGVRQWSGPNRNVTVLTLVTTFFVITCQEEKETHEIFGLFIASYWEERLRGDDDGNA